MLRYIYKATALQITVALDRKDRTMNSLQTKTEINPNVSQFIACLSNPVAASAIIVGVLTTGFCFCYKTHSDAKYDRKSKFSIPIGDNKKITFVSEPATINVSEPETINVSEPANTLSLETSDQK